LCKNELANGVRCSHIYQKGAHPDDTCPVCGVYAAIDINKEQKLDATLTENKLHRLFFERVPRVYEEMDLSIWESLGGSAWRNANAKEQVFLAFCMAFRDVSGAKTQTESEYWDGALKAEAIIRGYLVKNKIQVVKQSDFDLSLIADGMLAGTKIRTLQAHYGISLCGNVFQTEDREECERKYQKAIRVAERISIIGCSAQDNLPYFNAKEYLETV
jgi:hypothetical protein